MTRLILAVAVAAAALVAAPAQADPLAHCDSKVDVACSESGCDTFPCTNDLCLVSYSLRCVNPL